MDELLKPYDRAIYDAACASCNEKIARHSNRLEALAEFHSDQLLDDVTSSHNPEPLEATIGRSVGSEKLRKMMLKEVQGIREANAHLSSIYDATIGAEKS